MSERYKYTINGIYKCENFAEQVEQNRFPEIIIGLIGGVSRWYLKCTVVTKDDRTFLSQVISCDGKPKVRLRSLFNILKKDGSSGSMEQKAIWFSKFYHTDKLLQNPFEVLELLNPENGYLDDDGSLSIEYGFYVDAILDDNQIWKFNFHDIVFDYTGKKNQMVECTHTIIVNQRLKFYCSTEILNFHCPQFVEQAEKTVSSSLYSSDFFKCLQILHGVRLQIGSCDYFDILKTAHFFNLPNVIHYCDRPYIEGKGGFSGTKSFSFETVINFGLRHILAAKFMDFGWKDVVKTAKTLDFKEASGEVMKAFVAKILYNCQ